MDKDGPEKWRNQEFWRLFCHKIGRTQEMSDTVFLSAGIGRWYTDGIERLHGSLISYGWPYDIKIWKDDWPSNKFDRNCVYNIKADAFNWALAQGYKTIIWGDASIYAQGLMEPFVDRIKRDGYWIGMSGYNAAQTCSDACLNYFGVTRDWAEKVPDSATGLFGVNVGNPVALEFIETWIKAGRDGAFAGSRLHAGQSKDPRYLHHRQDQACASIIAGKLGMKLSDFIFYCGFVWDAQPTIFKCQGM